MTRTVPPDGAVCPVCGGADLEWSSRDDAWLCAEHVAPAVLAPARNGAAPLPDTAAAKTPRWPELPGHDADLGAIRGYLTKAARFPEGYAIDRAHRYGTQGTDAMTVTVRVPGQDADITVRFEHQDDAARPAALRTALARETKGLSRMRHPTQAQAADFFTMLCALASVAATATTADHTQAWLDEFLCHVQPVTGHSLCDPERRYDALQALRSFRGFERPQAQKYIRGELDPNDLPVLLLDDVSGEQWFRAGELATYLRHVYGVKDPLGQPTLDALLHEVGVSRHRMEVRRGSEHPRLVLYRLPAPPERGPQP